MGNERPLLKQRINPNTAGEGKSPTLGMNELNAAMEAEGKEIFRFGFVSESPFPAPDVAAIRWAAVFLRSYVLR